MSNNVHSEFDPGKAFEFLNEEDSETEEKVIKPKTEPVSPDLIDFRTQKILTPKNNYSSYENIREITPSAISTPSTSISSRPCVRKNKNTGNHNWGRADRESMDQQQTEITTLGSSSQTLVPNTKTENENKTLKRCCKYSVAVAVILIGISAVIVVIVTNNDQKYPPKADKQKSTDECGIYLVDSVQYRRPVNIEFNCTFTNNVVYSVTKIKIKFKPTYRYLSTSENIEKEITLSNAKNQHVAMTIKRWNINCSVVDKHLKCGLEREPVRCDNGGVASVTLYGKEELYQEEVEFDVEGEVSQVEMNVNQTIDERDNSTIVDIACSTQSSCTPTSIWLFSKKDGVTERRYDINFTCIIEYNTQDGTTVDCAGSIPGSLLKSFGTILCRPQLNDSVVAEAKEASVRPPVCIGDECTFTCPDEGADIYYMDPSDCTVLHRCASRRLYSGLCPNSTYFNPSKCSCDHQDNVEGCDDTGMRFAKLKDTRCGASTNN